MNITIFTGLFPNNLEPQKGTFVFSQAIETAKKLDVTVINPIKYMPKVMSLLGKRGASSEIPYSEKIGKLKILRPRYIALPFKIINKILFSVQMFLYLVFVFRAKSESHFHVHYADPFILPVSLLSLVKRINIVLTMHGSDVNYPLKGKFIGAIYKWAINRSSTVIFVSRALEKSGKNLGFHGGRTVVIPNGFPEEFFVPMNRSIARKALGITDNSRKIILYIGRLDALKGIDDLIEAFITLPNYSDYFLCIVGSGPHEQFIRSKISNLRVDNASIYPAVKHEIVPLWMAASDIVVLPSYSEGLPTIIPESFAMGKPVVATNVGGITEIITDSKYGLVVTAGDITGLGGALKQALENDWDDTLIIKYSKTYTWSLIAQRIINLYHQ